jgi:hypothetical protein
MDELGFDISNARDWFPHEHESPFILVRVDDAHTQMWADALGLAVRRCYVSDSLCEMRANALGVSKSEIIGAKLPDAGSTMSGDFGEILVYFLHAQQEFPAVAFGPKKWALKQDRTKPAPYSDVVQFILPHWPMATDEDVVLCSEVKTKATASRWSPIASAIEDCEKDRVSRLARTLVWLKERALIEDLGSIQIPHLLRFINATDHPPAKKQFYAVAVICSSLVDGELVHAPHQPSDEYTLVVVAVSELQNVYTLVFDAAKQALPVGSGAV